MARVEDAGLNATAPPQQRWLDGWLLRYQPGKARRARCINALTEGVLPLAQKLALAQEVYQEAGQPMIFRLSRFTVPAGLDAALERFGFARVDESAVMVATDIGSVAPRPLPGGLEWREISSLKFAETVGLLRGSPAEHRQSHAVRLAHSPIVHRAFVIADATREAALACGQFAREGEMVGIYDVFTDPQERNRGLATHLCERLLSQSVKEGAKTAYLQVDAINSPALQVYRRLGFAEAYRYHYRERPERVPEVSA